MTTTTNIVGPSQRRAIKLPDPSPLVGSVTNCNMAGEIPSRTTTSSHPVEIKNGFLVTTPRSPMTKKKSAIVPKRQGKRTVITKGGFFPNDAGTGPCVLTVLVGLLMTFPCLSVVTEA